MSLYFHIVINCDLREDISPNAIEAIKYLTSHKGQPKVDPQLLMPDGDDIWTFDDSRFLAPDPAHGVISNFYRRFIYEIPSENREVYRYRLQYSGSSILDDIWAHEHMPFLMWLVTVTTEDYIGYYMEHNNQGLGVQHLYVENGKLKDTRNQKI